jgi:hypothetical protein
VALRRLAMISCLVAALMRLEASVSAAGPTIVPDPVVTTVGVGQTADISIELQDVADVYGVDIRLLFDPFTMEVVDADAAQDGVQVQEGGFPQPDFTVRNIVDNSMGTINYAIVQLNPTAPVSGSGTVFSIQVRGKVAGRQSTLAVDSVSVSDHSGGSLTVQKSDGTVIVVSAADAPQPTASPALTPTPTTAPTTAPTETPTLPPPTATSSPIITATTTATAVVTGTAVQPTSTLRPASVTPSVPAAVTAAALPVLPTSTRAAAPTATAARQATTPASPTAPVRAAALVSNTAVVAPTQSGASAVNATATASSVTPRLALAEGPTPAIAAARAPMPLGPGPAGNGFDASADVIVGALMIIGGIGLLGLLLVSSFRRHQPPT